LEDCIVAAKFTLPPLHGSGSPLALPFNVPLSQRLLDPTIKSGNPAGFNPPDPFRFTNIDPATGNPITTVNAQTDYQWEYVWHCHLLGHEENDMMRPIKVTP
jgi:hypothetical protein